MRKEMGLKKVFGVARGVILFDQRSGVSVLSERRVWGKDQAVESCRPQTKSQGTRNKKGPFSRIRFLFQERKT